MEDINEIKQKTYELKQYANLLIRDLEVKLEKERETNESNYKSDLAEKETIIKEVNDELDSARNQNKKLEDEISRLKNTISNIRTALDSAVGI